MKLRQLTTESAKGRKILVRVDFNVPLKNGKVLDDTRIRAHLETLEFLKSADAKVALISHLGRPRGQFNADLSMRNIADEVRKVMGMNVVLAEDCYGASVANAMENLRRGEVLLLENVRFHSEEKENDMAFAEKIASPFDIFVMDAFSAAHRAHSSTNAIQRCLPSYAGKLLVREVEMLGSVTNNPATPFTLILGGAKVSDKIGVIDNLMTKASAILVGGGMAYTFLAVKGYSVGKSLFEEDKADFAMDMLKKAEKLGVDIVLPSDTIVAKSIDSSNGKLVGVESMPSGMMGLDIGISTVETFCRYILKSKTILWNGPMGVFEEKAFSQGTIGVAEAVAQATSCGAVSVIGGGDTASAARKLGFADKVSHVSTGGGASLEFCEGKLLPGIEPLLGK